MSGGGGSGYTGGQATALEDAIAQAEPVRDLLGEAIGVPAKRGPGRPPQARNRRTEENALRLIALHGDPLRLAVRDAAIDVTAKGRLDQLATDMGVDRKTALDFVARQRATVLPYLHQEQPKAVNINRGAPGNPIAAEDLFGGDAGEVVDAEFSEIGETGSMPWGEGEPSDD